MQNVAIVKHEDLNISDETFAKYVANIETAREKFAKDAIVVCLAENLANMIDGAGNSNSNYDELDEISCDFENEEDEGLQHDRLMVNNIDGLETAYDACADGIEIEEVIKIWNDALEERIKAITG